MEGRNLVFKWNLPTFERWLGLEKFTNNAGQQKVSVGQMWLCDCWQLQEPPLQRSNRLQRRLSDLLKVTLILAKPEVEPGSPDPPAQENQSVFSHLNKSQYIDSRIHENRTDQLKIHVLIISSSFLFLKRFPRFLTYYLGHDKTPLFSFLSVIIIPPLTESNLLLDS